MTDPRTARGFAVILIGMRLGRVLDYPLDPDLAMAVDGLTRQLKKYARTK